jgi:hypothetical protein
MKRLFGWLAGAVGGAAVYRALKRQPEPAADPAEELRAKLAETKGSDPEAVSDPAVPPDVDERRREVHEQGRAAIDELRDGAAPESN